MTLNIHILSNAQHFQDFDMDRLEAVHSTLNVLWGIPLYAPSALLHDQIVDKQGAFTQLLENIYALAASGAVIELRTVVTRIKCFGNASFGAVHSYTYPFYFLLGGYGDGARRLRKSELEAAMV